MTPAAVLQQHSKAQITEIVVARFGWRWLGWSIPGRGSNLPASLPMSPDELHGVRVWQVLGEIARAAALAGDPAPQSQVERARREEQEQVASTLRHLLDRQPTRIETSGVVALVVGLRAELVAPGDGLGYETAAEILSGHVGRLRVGPALSDQPVRSA